MENIGFNAEGMALNNSIRKRNVALLQQNFKLKTKQKNKKKKRDGK